MTDADAHERAIARLIESHRCFCKVLLKTADDPILLPIWLKHHLGMFRPEQLIIADNGSTDPDVLAIYETLPPETLVFCYTNEGVGFHNNIHDRGQFGWLYQALRASCEYVLFLDTDELLFMSEDARHWSADGATIEAMIRTAGGRAVSTTWVHDAFASLNTFYVGQDTRLLSWDLRWGKPFIPSSFDGPGLRIHNTQFPLELFDRQRGSSFYLLHLINYSKRQRMRVNKRKLVARSVADERDTWEVIASRNYDAHSDPTVRRLVGEIARLQAQRWPTEPDARLQAEHVRYAPGGEVQYGSDVAEKVVSDFRAGFSRFLERAFEI